MINVYPARSHLVVTSTGNPSQLFENNVNKYQLKLGINSRKITSCQDT